MTSITCTRLRRGERGVMVWLGTVVRGALLVRCCSPLFRTLTVVSGDLDSDPFGISRVASHSFLRIHCACTTPCVGH